MDKSEFRAYFFEKYYEFLSRENLITPTRLLDRLKTSDYNPLSAYGPVPKSKIDEKKRPALRPYKENKNFQLWLDKTFLFTLDFPELRELLREFIDNNRQFSIFFAEDGFDEFITLFYYKFILALQHSCVPYLKFHNNYKPVARIKKSLFYIRLINFIKQLNWYTKLSREETLKYYKIHFKFKETAIDKPNIQEHFCLDFSYLFVKRLLSFLKKKKIITNSEYNTKKIVFFDVLVKKLSDFILYHQSWSFVRTLPVFCKPSLFKKSSKLFNVNIGGAAGARPQRILSSTYDSTELETIRRTKIKKGLLRIINKMQRTPFFLIENFFDLLEKNPKIFWDLFLYISETAPLSIFIEKKKATFYIAKDYFREYSADASIPVDDVREYFSSFDRTALYFYRNPSRLEASLSFLQFYYNFDFNHKTIKLYNNVFLDYKGRIYISGIFTDVPTKLFKRLIYFDVEYNEMQLETAKEYYNYWLSFQFRKSLNKSSAIDLLSCFQKDISYIDARNTQNVLFDYIYKERPLNKITVTFESPSFLLQILAVLTKNEDLLYLTNLVLTTEDKIYDIYNDKIIPLLLKNLSEDNFLYTLCKDRDLIRELVIVYLCGFSLYETIPHIYNKFYEYSYVGPVHLTQLIYHLTRILKNTFVELKYLMRMTTYIGKFLYEKEEGYTFSLDKKIVHYAHKRQTSVKNFFTDDLLYYLDSANPNIRFIQFQSKGNISRINTSGRKLFSDLLHFIGSYISCMVCEKLSAQNIPFINTHDSFTISPGFTPLLLEAYTRSFEELHLNKNFNFFALFNYKKSFNQYILSKSDEPTRAVFSKMKRKIKGFSKRKLSDISFCAKYSLIPE